MRVINCSAVRAFFHSLIHSFLNVPYYERVKIGLLTASFFCIIASYTVLREMRDIIFLTIVGREYLQYAQIISMILLIPALFLYSYLVDRLRRHQLLYAYTIFYGVITVFIAFFLKNSAIGLDNTNAGPLRLFGWFQYIFIEGYAPFVVSLFFAFLNSVTPLKTAPQSYSIIVAGSKLGGMAIALFSHWFLTTVHWDSTAMLQLLLFFAAFLVLLVPGCIALLMRKVPERFMHGYEASYLVEKKEEKVTESESFFTRLISGLTLMVRYPYAMGIFGLVFFWEVISAVINYQRLGVCVALHKTLTELSAYLFLQIFFVHLLGFLLALVGTRILLGKFGERKSLIAIPVITGLLVILYFSTDIPTVLFFCYVLIRAVNYSVATSVREALYIPTTKVMRFKSKSWIDAFGAKFARGSGSAYNLVTDLCGAHATSYYVFFCGMIIGLWIMTAHLLGKRFEVAVKRNEVIG